MQIFNAVDAMTALWDFLKPLSAEIPVYKQVMDEAEENVPQSYLLIRADISNSGAVYGDGRALIRRDTADILLVSRATGARSDDIHSVNIRKVKAFLDAAGDASYTGYDLGYNATLKEAQYSWTLEFLYGKKR